MERHIRLTAAEQDVLRLLAHGRSYKEIADELSLSITGVRSRRQRFSERTDLRRLEVVAWATPARRMLLRHGREAMKLRHL